MGINLLPPFVRKAYEVHEWKHACAILRHDFPNEWNDLCELLIQFRFKQSWISVGGGRKSKISEAIDSFLYGRGWVEKQFDTQIMVDDVPSQSPTHKIDCFKNRVAVEIEWNNKDPFFDRDLNNFRLLFDLRPSASASSSLAPTPCRKFLTDSVVAPVMAHRQHTNAMFAARTQSSGT